MLLVVVLQNDVLILAGYVDCIEHGRALGRSGLLASIKVNTVVVLVALVVERRVGGVVQWIVGPDVRAPACS